MTSRRSNHHTGNHLIPVAPSGPNPTDPTGTTPGTSTGTTPAADPGSPSPGHNLGTGPGSHGSGSGNGNGGGGSPGDPYGYRSKAAKSFQRQADNLQVQADALLLALRHEYKDSLKTRLANIGRTLAVQDKILTDGYAQRLGALQGTITDNEKAESGQTQANLSNSLRERNSAVSEAMSQGAGETDLLQSQMMSLRNWNANQSEINRSLFDTVRSVNSSLADLNVDTKTGLINQHIQAGADREQLWTNYFNQRQDSLTQLGNVYGQQADLLAQAAEYGAKNSGKGAKNKARDAFHDAAVEEGRAWKNPGVPQAIQQWKGHGDFESDNNQSNIHSLQTVSLGNRPEGATLRKW